MVSAINARSPRGSEISDPIGRAPRPSMAPRGRPRSRAPAAVTWALLAAAFLVERFGAMHIQLYSTTNHIIWHKANGVSGSLYLIISLALLPFAGVNAFPLGILVAYLAFYSWYAPLHVYRAFRFDFWEFQRRTVLLPGSMILLYVTSIVLFASR